MVRPLAKLASFNCAAPDTDRIETLNGPAPVTAPAGIWRAIVPSTTVVPRPPSNEQAICVVAPDRALWLTSPPPPQPVGVSAGTGLGATAADTAVGAGLGAALPPPPPPPPPEEPPPEDGGVGLGVAA